MSTLCSLTRLGYLVETWLNKTSSNLFNCFSRCQLLQWVDNLLFYSVVESCAQCSGVMCRSKRPLEFVLIILVNKNYLLPSNSPLFSLNSTLTNFKSKCSYHLVSEHGFDHNTLDKTNTEFRIEIHEIFAQHKLSIDQIHAILQTMLIKLQDFQHLSSPTTY